ncbi:MAG: glycoside hydrolase family 88 protein, partial [Bacteroidaceae bacterium]|nr:glycoside hydrolase family 88 protein [Bacteroidaceae bacterium]
MKKMFFAALLFAFAGICATQAQELPDKKATLQTLLNVNKYFMRKNPDPGCPTFVRNKMRPSHLWTRGVYYEGVMALYGIYPQEELFDYTYQWGEAHKWIIRNGSQSRDADDQCCGQTFIDMYRLTGDRR